MTKEQRPQDWDLEERLNRVNVCGSLDDGAVSEQSRQQGIYPHHVKQWQPDFMSKSKLNTTMTSRSALNDLKRGNGALKKELNRKDNALAETAALLVRQEKVNAIWGSDEEGLH